MSEDSFRPPASSLQGDLFGDDAGAAAERMPTHFDTTRAVDIEAYRRTCGRQQRSVLDWFRRHPTMKCTPFEIHERVLPAAPVTSARRAMTNLTTAGLLVKTEEQRQERYGRCNHLWRLREGLADA